MKFEVLNICKMEDTNPLSVCLPSLKSPVSKNKTSNKSGRPTMKDMITFGPQPRSIVSQMLFEMKAKNDIEDKDEIICLDDLLADSLEVSKSEDHICAIDSPKSETTIPEELNKPSTKHKKFICDFPSCTYSCKLSSNLIKHKRVHTNDKPYLCEKCCFRSNFVNSLKAHKRTHTAERPYQCAHCDYKCNSSSNLKKHCRHRHPDASDCQCAKT